MTQSCKTFPVVQEHFVFTSAPTGIVLYVSMHPLQSPRICMTAIQSFILSPWEPQSFKSVSFNKVHIEVASPSP